MPNIQDMKSSRFLKRSDATEEGVVVTILGVQLENVGLESGPKDEKWCLSLREFPDKLMVLNVTNQRLCAKALGSEETDDWLGKKVLLVDDPEVEYKGAVVGGLRIRHLKYTGKAKAAPVVELTEDGEEIPF